MRTLGGTERWYMYLTQTTTLDFTSFSSFPIPYPHPFHEIEVLMLFIYDSSNTGMMLEFRVWIVYNERDLP